MKRPWLLVIALGISATISLCSIASVPILFKHYRIHSNGMLPSLKRGSIVVVRRRPYSSIQDVHRGDVVAWTLREGDATHTMIWRVIAFPGEHVSVEGTSVLVDGRALRQEFLRQEDQFHVFAEHLDAKRHEVAYDDRAKRRDIETDVPEGQLFMMGDNRDHAYDCRFTGPVPFNAVTGRAVWWSGA